MLWSLHPTLYNLINSRSNAKTKIFIPLGMPESAYMITVRIKCRLKMPLGDSLMPLTYLAKGELPNTPIFTEAKEKYCIWQEVEEKSSRVSQLRDEQ